MTGITYPGATSDSFSYNGLGARVSSSGVNGSKTWARNGLSLTSPVVGDGASTYTPGVSSRTGTATTYAHAGLKNSSDQSSSSGAVTANRVYDAFGNVVSSSGQWQGPFGYAGNFGYQEDGSGLKLLGHRYYDPGTGRFMTSDPAGSGSNWYAYGNNNPVTTSDPTGLVVIIRKVLKGSTKYFRRLGKPISMDDGINARRRGDNIIVEGLQHEGSEVDDTARRIEDQVKGKTIEHQPDDDYSHYQTKGKPGHTFKRLLPGLSVPYSDLGDKYYEGGGSPVIAFLIDMVNPMEEVDGWLDFGLSIATPMGLGDPYRDWPEGLPMPGSVAFYRGNTPVYN